MRSRSRTHFLRSAFVLAAFGKLRLQAKAIARAAGAVRAAGVGDNRGHLRNRLPEDTTFNILNYLYYYNGGGVAVGDVNNDGLPDLYFTSNLGPNRLYLNKGNYRFEDVTDAAGVADSLAGRPASRWPT